MLDIGSILHIVTCMCFSYSILFLQSLLNIITLFHLFFFSLEIIVYVSPITDVNFDKDLFILITIPYSTKRTLTNVYFIIKCIIFNLFSANNYVTCRNSVAMPLT